MESVVTIKKNQALRVIVEEITIAGRPAQVTTLVTYDQLMEWIRPAESKPKSKKSASRGRLFSRQVGLVQHALTKGKWSNGEEFNVISVLEKIITAGTKLNYRDIEDITDKGLEGLAKIGIIISEEVFPDYDLSQDLINNFLTLLKTIHSVRERPCTK